MNLTTYISTIERKGYLTMWSHWASLRLIILISGCRLAKLADSSEGETIVDKVLMKVEG